MKCIQIKNMVIFTIDHFPTSHAGQFSITIHFSIFAGTSPEHLSKSSILISPPSIVSTQWMRRVRVPSRHVVEQELHSLMYHLFKIIEMKTKSKFEQKVCLICINFL